MIRAKMSLFIFLFVFNILGLLLAELLSELSTSSSLKSPPDDFEDAASLSSSSSSEDAETGLFLSSSILCFCSFCIVLGYLCIAAYLLRPCGTSSSFVSPHT
jgi:hypothetical protein